MNDNVVNTKIIEDFIYVPKILKKMRETETYAIYLISNINYNIFM